MAWLSVNKDGSENISIKKLYRFVPQGIWYSYHIVIWDFSKLNNIIEFDKKVVKDKQTLLSKIPKGTIKKLIGKDLIWEDEPVEIKEKV